MLSKKSFTALPSLRYSGDNILSRKWLQILRTPFLAQAIIQYKVSNLKKKPLYHLYILSLFSATSSISRVCTGVCFLHEQHKKYHHIDCSVIFLSIFSVRTTSPLEPIAVQFMTSWFDMYNDVTMLALNSEKSSISKRYDIWHHRVNCL
jgi:hypothetical protein